jgi:peptide/nickel transport system substrate-binding protein
MRPRLVHWPTRSVAALVVVLAAGLALPPAADAQAPKRGGTLRVSYGNEIAHLDFHTAPGYEMMWVAMNVGCSLTNITPDGKFVGDAAESWTASSDGLLYTFKLRKSVFFHDGTAVDAAAVKFNIDRMRDPATKSGMRPFYEPVHSVEVMDPQTVQVRLKHPYAFFLHMVSAYRTGLILLSPASVQKFTENDRKQGKPGAIVGCGPFKFVEWVKGSHLAMERFDKYFVPGLPYLDKVLIRVIKDPVTEMAAFKAGEVDFIASFSPEHVDTMKAQNPKAQVMTGKETTPMLAAMKVTVPKDGKPMSPDRAPHPIFGDLRVRKAIGCYGLDRQEIVKIAFKGQATPWVGMAPPGTLESVNVNHLCPHDQTKAKALLTEAGYGPSKPLTLELMTNTEKSVFNIIATVVKEQLARIGVTANIRLVDKVSWMNTTLGDGPWDMYIEDLLSQLTIDSNGYLSTAYVSTKSSAWSHPRHTDTKVDDYYARYAKELDPVKRRALAKEFLEYMAENMYWNTISGSPFYMVAQPWLKGYTYNAEFEVHYRKVWLDK